MSDSDVSIKNDSYIWQNNSKNNLKIISSLTLQPWKGYGKKILKMNCDYSLKLEGLSKNKNKTFVLNDLEKKISICIYDLGYAFNYILRHLDYKSIIK